MKQLLLTGASGGMATALRPLIAELAEKVILSAPEEITDLAAHEESRAADLGDLAALNHAMEGCEAVIHLGGFSVEGPFSTLMQANILGLYNLYEAARANGMPRILFASSNHVVGYYKQSETVDASVLPRPDSLYGVTKTFGEALARFYFEKFGQETAILRIGSCLEEPQDHRMLATWLSHRDFISFARTAFGVETLGCPIVYGASANDRTFWDNSKAADLGWMPQDNSEVFAAKIEAACPNPDPRLPVNLFQGGVFTECPIFQDDD